MKRAPMSKVGRALTGLMLAVFLLPAMGGCGLFSPEEDPEGESLTVYTEGTVTERSDEEKYHPVDSFELMDGNYYYIYYLGIIDWVPLASDGASGFYYDGKVKSKHTFSFSSFSSEEVVDTLRSAVETGVSLTTKTYIKDSVGATAGIFEAKVESGIENSMTTSVKETLEHSVKNASLFQQTVDETHDYELTPGVNAAGYYLYTTVASMKVYESVVYDPASETILYMNSFGVLGQGLSGLVYSETSFFEPDDLSLTFEEEKLDAFEKPRKKLESQTVALDANGGSCELTSVEVAVGRPYPALPVPTRKNYVFDGWYVGDRKIEGGTEAVSLQTITAHWKPRTEQTIFLQGAVTLDTLAFTNVPNTTVNSIFNLTDYFDFAALREENYRLYITIECDLKAETGISSSTRVCRFQFTSGEDELFELEAVLSSSQTSYKHVTLYSEGTAGGQNGIPFSRLQGQLKMKIYTNNVADITVKDVSVKIRFEK